MRVLQYLQDLELLWMQRIILHLILANICVHQILAHSLAAYMPALVLLYYNNCRNLKHFVCRNWCWIQYWQRFVCSQHLPSVLLHVCLHLLHGCCYMISVCSVNTLNTGNNEMLHPILVNCIMAASDTFWHFVIKFG